MTDKELNSIYQTAYRHVLKMLETEKYKTPEAYKYLSPFVEEFRDWTAGVSGVGDLPPVPKE